MKEFDGEALGNGDGKEGRPVYVAYRGKVFDLSQSKFWKGGIHMGRHVAGKDLTTDIQAAPHSPEFLDRYPQIGILKEVKSRERAMPPILSALLARFPFLRRHPHPMVVHFPIAFTVSTTFFTLLSLLTGVSAFRVTALHCLAGAILFTPIAIGTGWFTWWLNYGARPLRSITMKKRLSLLLLAAQTLAFTWGISAPDALDSFRWTSAVYLFLLLSFLPLVTLVGWYGALMTFPVEKE